MTKVQLAQRFRARHRQSGYFLEYTNFKTTWTMYTPYSSDYDNLADAENLTYKELLTYRFMIIAKALKKITI